MNARCQIQSIPPRQNGANTMSTEDLLVEWGLWLNSMDSPIKGYVSPALAVSQTQNRMRSLPDCTIDDETAVMVDQAVASLTAGNKEMGHGLVMYFCWRWSYRQIGNRWGVNKTQVQQMIQRSIAWVDGNLDRQRRGK